MHTVSVSRRRRRRGRAARPAVTAARRRRSRPPRPGGRRAEAPTSGPSPISPELKELVWGLGAFLVLLVADAAATWCPKVQEGDGRPLRQDPRRARDGRERRATPREPRSPTTRPQLAAVRAEASARIDAARATLEAERAEQLAEVNAAHRRAASGRRDRGRGGRGRGAAAASRTPSSTSPHGPVELAHRPRARRGRRAPACVDDVDRAQERRLDDRHAVARSPPTRTARTTTARQTHIVDLAREATRSSTAASPRCSSSPCCVEVPARWSRRRWRLAPSGSRPSSTTPPPTQADAEAEAAQIRQAIGDIDAERARLLAEADVQAEALLDDGRARLERRDRRARGQGRRRHRRRRRAGSATSCAPRSPGSPSAAADQVVAELARRRDPAAPDRGLHRQRRRQRAAEHVMSDDDRIDGYATGAVRDRPRRGHARRGRGRAVPLRPLLRDAATSCATRSPTSRSRRPSARRSSRTCSAARPRRPRCS